MSKLSKVKRLWDGSTSPELKSDDPNAVSMNTGHITRQEQGDTKFSVKREAWERVTEKDSMIDEDKTVHVDQDQKEEIAHDKMKSVSLSTQDDSAMSSKALKRNDVPSSAGFGALDEKLEEHSSKGGEKQPQTSSSAAGSATLEEQPKQKPTRRGGRGRKRKSSRQNETASNASEKPKEKALGDPANNAKDDKCSHQQQTYDDLKGDALKASPAGKKPREEKSSDRRQGDLHNLGRDAQSRPHQMPKQKDSSTSAKDKEGPKENKQGARKRDPDNSPRGKGGAPKQGARTRDLDSFRGGEEGAPNREPEGNKELARTRDPDNSPGEKEGVPNRGLKGNKQGAQMRDPDNSPGGKGGALNRGAEGNKQGARMAAPDNYPMDKVEAPNRGPNRKKQGARTEDPDNSPKGKGGASKREPEGNKQGGRTKDPGKSTGGKGGAQNKGQRRPHSRSQSEELGGKKDDSRNRSSSIPEKRPSKNS